MNIATPGMFGLPGGAEWVIIGLIALLIFGRRLPDVARSVGKSIVEFKRGIRDVKDEVDVQSQIEPPPTPKLENKPESAKEAPPASETSKESSRASS